MVTEPRFLHIIVPTGATKKLRADYMLALAKSDIDTVYDVSITPERNILISFDLRGTNPNSQKLLRETVEHVIADFEKREGISYDRCWLS